MRPWSPTRAGAQSPSTSEGPQAALESLKRALEQHSEAAAAGRRLSSGGKSKCARGMAVVVLDEMDQLLSQDHSVLYDLFRLPQASLPSWAMLCLWHDSTPGVHMQPWSCHATLPAVPA